MSRPLSELETNIVEVCRRGVNNRAEIARQLGIADSTVRGAYRRLAKLGVLEWTRGGTPNTKLPAGLEPVAPTQNTAAAIDGLTPEDHLTDGAELIEHLIARQDKAMSKALRRHSQAVTLPGDKPVAVALLSDLHFGNANTDYKAIRADAELIRDTDGLFAVALGDYHDNWIGKLIWVANDQPVTLENELALVQHWLNTLGDKLVAAVGGNHESRTKRAAGFDHLKLLLRGSELLYDADEIPFALKLGSAEWKCKLRHRWKGSSIYNESHGMERDLHFGAGNWDIAMQGHTHRGTVFRESYDEREGKIKLTVQIGTYEFHDRYAIQLGMTHRQQSGSGAIVFCPDGRFQGFRDLQLAVEFMRYLRKGG